MANINKIQTPDGTEYNVQDTVSGYITSSYHDTTKQDTLVSGTNIKTINNNSILGSGNITIQSGGGALGMPNYNAGISLLNTKGTVQMITQNGLLFASEVNSHLDIDLCTSNGTTIVKHFISSTGYSTNPGAGAMFVEANSYIVVRDSGSDTVVTLYPLKGV